MENFSFYVDLGLDHAASCGALYDELDSRIRRLREQGQQSSSPEVDQLTTARNILGDERRRAAYDAALNSGDPRTESIAWLHDLAESQPAQTGWRARPDDGPVRHAAADSAPAAAGRWSLSDSPAVPSTSQSAAVAASSLVTSLSWNTLGRKRSQSKMWFLGLAVVIIGCLVAGIIAFVQLMGIDDVSYEADLYVSEYFFFGALLFIPAHTVAVSALCEFVWWLRQNTGRPANLASQA